MSDKSDSTVTSNERLGWRDFLLLTKPGIIMSNLITAFGGFWIASGKFGGEIDWSLLASAMLGTAIIIGAGCVLNNYLDRDMDTRMARTQKRALPSGLIQPNV